MVDYLIWKADITTITVLKAVLCSNLMHTTLYCKFLCVKANDLKQSGNHIDISIKVKLYINISVYTFFLGMEQFRELILVVT